MPNFRQFTISSPSFHQLAISSQTGQHFTNLPNVRQFHQLAKISQIRQHGCGSKIGTQNGTLSFEPHPHCANLPKFRQLTIVSQSFFTLSFSRRFAICVTIFSQASQNLGSSPTCYHLPKFSSSPSVHNLFTHSPSFHKREPTLTEFWQARSLLTNLPMFGSSQSFHSLFLHCSETCIFGRFAICSPTCKMFPNSQSVYNLLTIVSRTCQL